MKTIKTSVGLLFVCLFAFNHFGKSQVKQDVIALYDDAIQFVENKGQWHKNVVFRSPLGVGAVFLEKNTFTYVQYDPADLEEAHVHNGDEHHDEIHMIDGHAWRTNFLGANEPKIIGENKRKGYHNYFIGNDKSKWASHVGIFDDVTYSDLYKGIGMRIHQSGGIFKYDFVVAPGADPGLIQMEFEGLNAIYLRNGKLVMETSIGEFLENKPVTYQYIEGEKINVPCRFAIDGNVVSFELPESYNSAHELIIDPELVGATLSGGTATNYGHCATYDEDGNMYSGARSFGPGYPTDMGSFQTDHGGTQDMAFSKFNPDGSTLLYATYLGGAGVDLPHSIVVSEDNELYTFGTTKSIDYPVSDDAFDSSGPDGGTTADIAITHLTEDGSGIVGSTFVGGSAADGENNLTTNYGDTFRGEIILDSDGNCYIASCTASEDFPVTAGVFQDTYGGGTRDAVVFSMNEELSAMNWSTYIGGENSEGAFSLRLDDENDVYVTGAASGEFITMTGYIDAYQGGPLDAYALKLTDNGTTIPNATFWGTPDTDAAFFLDLDNDGNVYLYGQSNGGASEVTDGVYVNPGSNQFICALSPDLSTLELGTVIGDGTFIPIAFMVDACGYIYFSGHSVSGTLPLTDDALYTSGGFYLGVLQPDAVELEFATLYSGNHVDGGTSRFDPDNGTVYQGVCSCEPFTVTDDAYASTKVGFCDIGVFKIDFGISHVNASAEASPSIEGCAPFTVDFANESAGLTYEWDFGDGSPVATDFEPTHTFEDPGIYEVRLVAFDPDGCLTSDTTYLEISVGTGETPEASFEYDVNCATGEVTVTFTGTEGVTTVFDMGDETIIEDDEFTYTYATEGTFTITVTAGDGICADFATAEEEIIVGASPVDLIFNSPTCVSLSDGSIVVNISGGDGSETITITDADGEERTEEDSNVANLLEAGWYYYTVDLGDGCDVSDSVQLMDPPQLNVQLNVINPPCFGEETGYAIVDTVYNYQGAYENIAFNWTPDDVEASGLGGDSLWNLGAGQYVLTINDEAGCSRIFDFEVVDYDKLEFAEFGASPAYCRTASFQNGNGVVFAAGTGGVPGYSYRWRDIATGDETSFSTWGSRNPGDYEITIIDQNGCILMDTIRMDSLSPEAFFDVVSDDLNGDCQGNAPVEVKFVNQSMYFVDELDPSADTIFFFTPNEGVAPWVLSTSYFEEFDTVYTEGGVYDVCLKVVNSNGCEDVYCKPITVYNNLVFTPVNIFSPDGDGINDNFTFVYRSEAVIEFSCIVTNRWGIVVAEFDNITDTWDGTDKNGDVVPDGVYFYVYSGRAENSDTFDGQGTVQKVGDK